MVVTDLAPAAPRRRLLVWILLALAGAVAAHVVYWYWPRIHAARPVAGGEARALLDTPDYDVALWIPYPHQNLAALERRVGNLDDLARALARLSGAPAPQMPRLGPFRLPPARELAWAASADGHRWRLVVRLYPAVAIVLRAAGRLAGNPWLSGGTVDSAGRHLEVTWMGSQTWCLEPRGERVDTDSARRAGAGTATRVEADESAVGLVRLATPHETLPAGTYRISARDGALEATMGDPPAGTLRAIRTMPTAGAALTLLRREHPSSGDGVAALAIVPGPSDRPTQLPTAVSLSEGLSSPLGLPGERQLGRLGIHPLQRRFGTWTIRAWDDSATEFGRRMVPRVKAWASGDSRQTTAVQIDLAAIGRWAASLGAGLNQLPLVGEAMAGRWLDVARLAQACGPRARLLAAVNDSPPSVAIRLEQAPQGSDRH